MQHKWYIINKTIFYYRQSKISSKKMGGGETKPEIKNPDKQTKTSVIKIGQYQLLQNSKSIGQGCYGKVYKGYQSNKLQYPVAIKILNASFGNTNSDIQNLESIKKQIQMQKSVAPKYAPQIFWHGFVNMQDHKNNNLRKYCIVMEFMNQGSLQYVVRHSFQNILQEKLAINFISKIIKVYQGLFYKNIIHRDLKPQNILISKKEGQYQVKLGDFGISKVLQGTLGHSAVGTPQYQSPQQGKGMIQTSKSDAYSLGCIFFRLIVGSTPLYQGFIYKWKCNYQVLEQVLSNKKVSKQVINFISRCLAEQQKERISWQQIFSHDLFLNQQQKKLKKALMNTKQHLDYLKGVKQIKQIVLQEIKITPDPNLPGFDTYKIISQDKKLYQSIFGQTHFNQNKQLKGECFRCGHGVGHNIISKEELPTKGHYVFSIKVHKLTDNNQISIGIVQKNKINCVNNFNSELMYSIKNKIISSGMVRFVQKQADSSLQMRNGAQQINVQMDFEQKKIKWRFNGRVQASVAIPYFYLNKSIHAQVYLTGIEKDVIQFV